MTTEDTPSYTNESWSESARAELKEKLAQISDAQCREVIQTLLSLDDSAFLLACLRGTLSGLAARGNK